jgi:DNA polymerase I-like protein with 3'-5' exonuclease and polymerase domains
MEDIWIADIETNALLDDLNVIHCIVLRRPNGKARAYHDDPDIKPRHGSIDEALDILEKADGVVWHNGIGFDEPAIRKLRPDWSPPPTLIDTYVASRLIWPDIKRGDFRRMKRGFPPQLAGKHNLESWGWRLHVLKGQYQEGDPNRFQVFDREMLLYCAQDTKTTDALFNLVLDKQPSQEAVELEHAFARIMVLQPHAGFLFDAGLSGEILADLKADYAQVDHDAHQVYPDIVTQVPYPSFLKTGKPWRGKTHKEVVTEFNPGSRPQIAERLQEQGWVPEFFTDGGAPKLGNDTLRDLAPRFPECELFADRFDLGKRLSQLDHGEQSWLNNVRPDGRIPAEIIHNGTVTSRCTHRIITSVPKKNVAHGGRMRELFIVPEGRRLTGWDASSLEARCLAHYLAKYDGGAYAQLVLEGDIHALTISVLGEDRLLKNWSKFYDSPRDCAKRVFYGWLYGGGNWKLGYIAGFDPGKGPKDKKSQAFKAGARIRAALLEGIPGLGDLVDSIKAAGNKNGWLKGLDGRHIPVRSDHAALNTALQGAGAVLMKKATVLFHGILTEEEGLRPFDWFMDPLDAQFVQVGHWHDEVQTEHDPDVEDAVRAAGPRAIREAGTHFKFRIALDGEAKSGTRWSETH